MAKPGTNKKRCEKYKQSGNKAHNKQLRQERHQKRMDRFAKRRANKPQDIIRTASKDGDPRMAPDGDVYSRRPNQCELSWWTGVMRRLQNRLDKEAQRAKAN